MSHHSGTIGQRGAQPVRAMDALDGYLSAQIRLNEAGEELSRAIVGDPALSQEDIWYLYWCADVPVGPLATRLDVPISKVASLCSPGPLIQCPGCGNSATARSRSELQQATTTRKWRGSLGECRVCSEERERGREESAVYWERETQRRLSLQTMPYSEYLRTPEWQEKRRAALKRARYACQVCNASGVEINVHHRTYERRGQEWAADLIALCRPCHERHHGIVP